MYELTQVGKRTYYIESPAKIGLYLINDEEVCLIDTGNDKDAGKKVLKIIESNNWKLKMIINTHSHADHIGGNQVLQQRTGCKIYAIGTDRGFTEHPVLEPALLYGANPPKELRGKGFMAKESHCQELTEEILPEGLTITNLSGHTEAQIGLRTSDDVVFLADCLMGENILEKYRISYIFDVGAYLQTLNQVKEMKAALFIPSHSVVSEDIVSLVDANIRNTLEIMEDILIQCQMPRTIDEVIGEAFDRYKLEFSFGQYFLNGTTIKAMVSYLHDLGKLEMVCEDNRIRWKTISN